MKDKKKIVLPGDFIIVCKRSYLVYECRTNLFKKNTSGKLTARKSTGTDHLSANSDLKAISDGALLLPTRKLWKNECKI